MSRSGDQQSRSTAPQDTLPPGMVLGPDGKPCKICTAFKHWSPVQDSTKALRGSKNESFETITNTLSALATGPNTLLRPNEPPEGCPPDVEQLGRATWTFLHTTAAYYPENPSPIQRTRMIGLMFALPVLYPCSWCALHLSENLKLHPPDVSGRAALSKWLCERHNDVNERLGKPLFDCSMQNLDMRWKDGPSDGRCD